MTQGRDVAMVWAEQALVAEEVLSVLRHDVRNKLAAARQAGYYLRDRIRGTDVWNAERRVPQFFDLFEDQLGLAEQMLAAHAAMSALYARRPTSLDPSAVADSAIENVSDVKGRIDRESFEAARIVADVNELVIALRCLLDNALDASADEGRVRFCGRAAPTGYMFAISDTGPGLPPDAFRRLSRPLETTKADARGLGLGIARRVASRYGGALRVVETAGGVTLELRVGLEADR